MKIGNRELEGGAILAPMAGVTDYAYRRLAEEYGATALITEMVSCKALEYGDKKTEVLCLLDGESKVPQGIQIFGSEANVMKLAVRNSLLPFQPDFIDINMGCPVPKIVKNGEGSALMLDDLKAYHIVSEIKKVCTVPLSVKIRLGFTRDRVKAASFAKVLEDAGADFIACHARTRDMFYSGEAMIEEIAKIKEAVKIPVIANGDIFRPEDALRALKITGADAIMVGRGALGKPWIFKQIKDYLETGSYEPEPSIDERADIIIRHFNMMLEYKSERTALLEMRKHAAWYLKGLSHSSKIKNELNHCLDKTVFFELIEALKG